MPGPILLEHLKKRPWVYFKILFYLSMFFFKIFCMENKSKIIPISKISAKPAAISIP